MVEDFTTVSWTVERLLLCHSDDRSGQSADESTENIQGRRK